MSKHEDLAVKWVLLVMALGFATLGAVALTLLVGCSHLPAVIEGVQAATNAVPVIVGPQEPEQPAQPEQPALSDEIDLSTVVWHEADIRAWPIKADLKACYRGSQLMLETGLLKGVEAEDHGMTGNPWVIALCKDGRWHAATWEWIDYSRQSRDAYKLLDRRPIGGHINQRAFDGVVSAPGTVVYVAVSGCGRSAKRTIEARTPFRKLVVR